MNENSSPGFVTSEKQAGLSDDHFYTITEHMLNNEIDLAIDLCKRLSCLDKLNESQFEYISRLIDHLYFMDKHNTRELPESFDTWIELLCTNISFDSIALRNIYLCHLSTPFLTWLQLRHYIFLDQTSLWFVIHQYDTWFQYPSTKASLIDLHPATSITIDIFAYTIRQLDCNTLSGLIKKKIQRKQNTDKPLILFSSIFSEETYILQEEQVNSIVHCIIHYYLKYPIYIGPVKKQKELSLHKKVRWVLEHLFMTANSDLIHFGLEVILQMYQDKANEHNEYEFLHWDSLPNDLEVFRKSSIYPISSDYKHHLLGYLSLYYKGEDPNMIAISIQFYKEYIHKPQRRMSEFQLE